MTVSRSSGQIQEILVEWDFDPEPVKAGVKGEINFITDAFASASRAPLTKATQDCYPEAPSMIITGGVDQSIGKVETCVSSKTDKAVDDCYESPTSTGSSIYRRFQSWFS